MTRILLDSVPSTNDYALDLLARERPPEHTMVQAVEQTRGKGQPGRVWSSERGKNLTVSVILYPTFLAPEAQFRLTQVVALAVADVVERFVPDGDTRIKWPNDVMLDQRKVAGILIETRLHAGRVEAAVVGIGLNANQTVFPPEAQGAGSLALGAGRAVDLEILVQHLGERLAHRYGELRGEPAMVQAAYHDRLLGLGRSRVFRDQRGDHPGTITGVDTEGRLVVRGEDGVTRSYQPREITWIS